MVAAEWPGKAAVSPFASKHVILDAGIYNDLTKIMN
jgi:hypothetical protein